MRATTVRLRWATRHEERAQDYAQQPVAHRHHDCAENTPPEIVDDESEAELLSHGRDEHEQRAVDNQGDQPEREQIDGERDDANEITDDGVDDPEDRSYGDVGQHEVGVAVSEGDEVDAVDEEIGHPECDCVGQKT